MIELGILIFCSGCAVAAIVASAAHAYRTITEIKIKRQAFEASLRDTRIAEPEPDELAKRLEEFRRTRFAPPSNSGRQTPVK